ncbi:MAG: N-acetylmuramoyl-L-alanine amidase [Candidatus Margulisiibacteriota bacterium]
MLLIIIIIPLFLPVFADQITLTQIEAGRDRGIEYIDINTSGWTEAKGLLLERTLYIDFPETRKSPKFELIKGKLKHIKSLSVIQKNATTTRLVISLKHDVDYDIVNVFGRNKTVVELYSRSASSYKEQYAWEEKNTTPKFAPLKPVKLSPKISTIKPKSTRQVNESLHGRSIIIDPGHGGDDPGATACNGVQEKYLTLATAKRVAALLREAGATVYMTRAEDRRSSLSDVTNFANKTRADIFISIHYNSTYSRDIAGTETYYYNPVSRRFAEIMHEALIRGLGRKDRGLRRVRFFTVKHATMPAVLLEPAFLSNNDEADLARSAEFEDRIAESIKRGVELYFRNSPR